MAISKSSMAIDSFLEYFKDAKPYHTKILEIVEEYNFSEDMFVVLDERVEKTITLQNDPLCKLTGFGIDYDDDCGYDAIDCCDLFDCSGGYGVIFDNSDLLVETTITSKDDALGVVSVAGNQISDTKIPVIDIINSTKAVLRGDASALLDSHSTFIFVNVLQFDVLSNDSDSITIDGNHVDFIKTKSNFKIEGTETVYNGAYTVRDVSYDVDSNSTIIRYVFFKPITDNALTGVSLQFRNSNSNGGIYQLESYTFNGTNTVVEVSSYNNFEVTSLSADRLGSFQFRTGLRQPREIDVVDAESDYHNILYSEYDSANNATNLYLDGDVSSYTVGVDTVKLYGYFFGSGYDGEVECTKPKEEHIHSILEENLLIEVNDGGIIAPTPTPTPTPTPSPLGLFSLDAASDQIAICANIVSLSDGVILTYTGNIGDLTFSWEQVSGTPVNIINPTTFDATINLTAITPDVRVFRVTVNAGEINEASVETTVSQEIRDPFNTDISNSMSSIKRGGYSGSVEYAIRLYSDIDVDEVQSCGTGKSMGVFTTNRTGYNTETVNQELQVWNGAAWITDTITDGGGGQRFPLTNNLLYRIRTVFRNKVTDIEYIEFTESISTGGPNTVDNTILVSDDRFNSDISDSEKSKAFVITRIQRQLIVRTVDDTDNTFNTEISSGEKYKVYAITRIERSQIERIVETTDNTFTNGISGSNDTTQGFDINRLTGISIST